MEQKENISDLSLQAETLQVFRYVPGRAAYEEGVRMVQQAQYIAKNPLEHLLSQVYGLNNQQTTLLSTLFFTSYRQAASSTPVLDKPREEKRLGM